MQCRRKWNNRSHYGPDRGNGATTPFLSFSFTTPEMPKRSLEATRSFYTKRNTDSLKDLEKLIGASAQTLTEQRMSLQVWKDFEKRLGMEPDIKELQVTCNKGLTTFAKLESVDQSALAAAVKKYCPYDCDVVVTIKGGDTDYHDNLKELLITVKATD